MASFMCVVHYALDQEESASRKRVVSGAKGGQQKSFCDTQHEFNDSSLPKDGGYYCNEHHS